MLILFFTMFKIVFKGDYPARAAYAVAALPKGASIEIEGNFSFLN